MTTSTLNRVVPYFAAGHKFDEPVSVEQAFSQAHLRWEVEQKPLAWIGDPVPYGTNVHLYKDGAMMVRTDTNEAFGPVGSRYTEIQNTEVEELLDGAGYRALAAGAIDGGQKCFAVLDAGAYSNFKVDGDPFFSFIVARWNHDGSGGVKIGTQIWRQWCTNGQKRIEAQQMISVRHTSGKDRYMIEARSVVEQLGEAVELFAAQTVQLQGQRFTPAMGNELLRRIFPKPVQKGSVDGQRKALDRWAVEQTKLQRILNGPTIGDWANTAHGIVQTVNEYEQWATRTRHLSRSQILRLDADRFPATERALALVAA